jgi:hypothetical protein
MKNTSVTLMVLALGLAACDRSADPDPAAAPSGSAPAAAAPATGSTGSDAVQAVLQTQGTPVAKLQFVLPSRPVAGTPFPLQLHVTAPAPVPELQLAAESSSLAIEPATATLALETPDVAVVHQVMLNAAEPGLVDLLVRLKAADAPEAVYAVPVLVAAAAAAP